MSETIQEKISTKDFIISSAAELFNLYGYNGCSMNDIMEATGLKKGGIYNHFSSKDEIALAAYNYSYGLVIKRFRANLDVVKTAQEKLYAIIETYEGLMDEPTMKGGCPIFNTAVDAIDFHPSLAAKAKEGINRLQRYVEIKIEQGIEDAEFMQRCKPDRIASMIIIHLEGAIIMSRVSGDKQHMRNAVIFLKDYVKTRMIV
jgi:AcrR family transcriptional regulator